MIEADFVHYFENFSTAKLVEFLEARGWRYKQIGNQTIFASAKDESGNFITYLIPESSTKDFKNLVYRLFEGASIVEATRISNIINEFSEYLESNLRSLQTKIKFKFGNENFKHISLEESESVSYHARLLVSHAVDNEIKPLIFRPTPTNQSKNVVEKFEVYSQASSYVFVVSSPFEMAVQQTFSLLEDEISIYTKAILRIAKGLEWMENNSNNLDDFELVASASEFGLNANMAQHLCALLKSVPVNEKGISFLINSKLAKAEKLNQTYFPMRYNQLTSLQKVYDLLGRFEEMDLSLKVRVVKLDSNDPTQEKFSHKITANVISKDSEFFRKKITIELSKSAYNKAIKAHGNGKLMTLTGRFAVRGTEIKVLSLDGIT